MSERKVLSKYYPPDFDAREIARKRGPKNAGPKVQAVRLMAPFSMKCTTCGEYIYRGRKFNSRKETPPDEKYLGIQIFFFSIKCTRCSAEIIFRTDPKNNDYAMVKGALRNMEPWRNRDQADETVEQRLDRLEREEAEAAGDEAQERNAMADLEAKNADARREMAVADELDDIRRRNARIARADKEGVDYADMVVRPEEEERARQDREDEEAARAAFAAARRQQAEDEAAEPSIIEEVILEEPGAEAAAEARGSSSASASTSTPASEASKPATDWKPKKKVKKDYSAMLGIKKKPAKPSLV